VILAGHLPDQDSRCFGMFLFLGLVLTCICCLVWMWYFKVKCKFPDYSVTSPMIDELVTFTAIVSGVVILAGLYGVKSFDRGWLLVTVIGQISLTNTIHFGISSSDPNSDAQIKRIDACLLVACTFTAWAAWRTSKKIKEEQFLKERTLGKKYFSLCLGLDLPDMTFAGMELWLIATSILLLVFGTVFVILGSLTEINGPNSYQIIWHMYTCGAAQIVAGASHIVFASLGYARTRITLTITMMTAMFGMIVICTMTGLLCFARAFFVYDCDGFNITMSAFPDLQINDCNARANLTSAQVIFQYFSLLLTAGHVWLSWRLSERVQTQALYNEQNEIPTPVSVFSKQYTLLGIKVNRPYDLYVWNLMICCLFTFAAAGGLLVTWFVINRADTSDMTAGEATNYNQLSPYILDNYVNVILNISAVVMAMFGKYDNDRGVLLITTLLFLTTLGINYHNFLGEYSRWYESTWFYGGNELPQTWIKDMGRISSYSRLITIISAWFGAFNTYAISEILQEKSEMEAFKGNL